MAYQQATVYAMPTTIIAGEFYHTGIFTKQTIDATVYNNTVLSNLVTGEQYNTHHIKISQSSSILSKRIKG